MIAHDVYAETNPAYCAYVLTSFLRGFVGANPQGADLPVVYLGLPICISGDLISTFDKTNKKTGLREWYERSPQIQIDLGERLNGSLALVTEAVRLGCFSNALRLDPQGRMSPGTLEMKSDLANGLSPNLAGTMRRADRLGHWIASAGSTKTIFDILELSL